MVDWDAYHKRIDDTVGRSHRDAHLKSRQIHSTGEFVECG